MGRRAILPLSAAVMTALGTAAASGLLATDAAAQVVARKDENDAPPPLIVVPPGAASRVLIAHESHSSHSSHSSHYSSSSGGGGGYTGGDDSTGAYEPAPVPPPPRPKPARVSFVAFPGGQIFIDGKLMGRDATQTLLLKPGTYNIKIVNRFIGEHTSSVDISDGETGVVTINW